VGKEKGEKKQRETFRRPKQCHEKSDSLNRGRFLDLRAQKKKGREFGGRRSHQKRAGPSEEREARGKGRLINGVPVKFQIDK